jgi:hypothetical protein
MTEPTPVEPLEYFNRSQEPWLPMIRFVAVAGAFYAVIPVVYFLFQVAELVAPMPVTPIRTISSSWQLLIQLPSIIAAAAIVVGGILAARFNPAGRTALLAGALAYVIFTSLYGVWNGIYVVGRMPPAQRPSFAMFEYSSIVFSLAQRCFMPILLWIFFRRTEVREAMLRGK